MPELRVQLAEAPTDVLVALVDEGPTDFDVLVDTVPPADAPERARLTRRAVTLLSDMGLVALGDAGWFATPAGVEAVRTARRATP